MTFRPPPGDESNPDLVRVLIDLIEREGPMTFAQFVDVVAGHPDHGYYATSVERVGRQGDFLTAPETHPMFGWLVARQVLDFWQILGAEPALTVREHGAGRGTLAKQIIGWIHANEPEELRQVRYELDDVNPEHVARLRQTIDPGSDSVEFLLTPADQKEIIGVQIANELLDALPFHRLTYQGGEFREIRVAFVDGWFVERAGPLSSAALDVIPDNLTLSDGQRIEVAPAVRTWIQNAANMLERGYIIVFDYGYERPEIFDERRFPDGTLKTYRQHEVGDDPFLHIGRQDITAHVDFSLLIQSALDAGLRLEGLTTQAEFVAGMGLDEILLDIQRHIDNPAVYVEARAAAMDLLDPGGLGRFRVAIFSKDVGPAQPLRGLSFRLPGRTR